MNRRSLLLLTVLGLTAGACASGGTGSTNQPNPTATSNVPERTFPPGTAPSQNRYTRSAQVYLDQADATNANDEKQRRYTDALEQARGSIESEPNNPLGYYQAGISLLGLERYEEAGQMLDRAEEIYPRYQLETDPLRQNAWVTLYNSAVSELQQGNEDRAVELMKTADLIFQDRPEARTNLAVIYTNRGEYDAAIEWYLKTLETLRSDARQYLPAAVQADWAQRESDVTFNLAQVYQRAGRSADAIALFREHLATHPDDAAVKTQLALALSAEGQEAEAAQLFAEVLNMQGLEPDDYYRIGIGLFNAGRFDDAVVAFERAVAANPYFRDAVFNLTQALMAQANGQAEAGAADADIVPTYERLVEVSDMLRGIDPFNRNAALVLANAMRNLADLTTGTTSSDYRNELVELLGEIEALPFDVSDVAMSQAGPGRIRVAGSIENLTLSQGTPIQLRVSILGSGGTPIGTQDVTVTAPAQESSVPFSAEFETTSDVLGWRYERI